MTMNQNNQLQHNKDIKGPHSRIVSVQEHFSGPLPHPETLEKYNIIVPGAADRIISKFEQQTDHRQKIEKIVIWADSLKSLAGLLFGFIIAMTALIGGIITALRNHVVLGGSISFTGIALLVGAFVANRYGQRKKE